MKRGQRLAAAVLLCAVGVVVHASDQVAVYARVDRVVFEPNADMPDAIQVWGVFSLAKPANPNDYLPAARGYLYFALPGNTDVARREWADLRQVAGTNQIVAFGSRYQLHARLRAASEQPKDPDPYVLAFGLSKVQGRTEYSPVRALIDFRD